jgi:ABC-type multidrug transport system ATPase subunit
MAVSANALSKFYQDKKVLDSLSFEIEKGSFLVLSAQTVPVKPAFSGF